jgi:hypothetical protein
MLGLNVVEGLRVRVESDGLFVSATKTKRRNQVYLYTKGNR